MKARKWGGCIEITGNLKLKPYKTGLKLNTRKILE